MENWKITFAGTWWHQLSWNIVEHRERVATGRCLTIFDNVRKRDQTTCSNHVVPLLFSTDLSNNTTRVQNAVCLLALFPLFQTPPFPLASDMRTGHIFVLYAGWQTRSGKQNFSDFEVGTGYETTIECRWKSCFRFCPEQMRSV